MCFLDEGVTPAEDYVQPRDTSHVPPYVAQVAQHADRDGDGSGAPNSKHTIQHAYHGCYEVTAAETDAKSWRLLQVRVFAVRDCAARAAHGRAVHRL